MVPHRLAAMTRRDDSPLSLAMHPTAAPRAPPRPSRRRGAWHAVCGRRVLHRRNLENEIGKFVFEMASIYVKDGHEIYKQWVALCKGPKVSVAPPDCAGLRPQTRMTG